MTNLANELSLHFYIPVYDLSDYQLSNEQLQYTAMPSDAVHRVAVQADYHPIVILEKDIPAGFFVLHGDGAKMYSDNKKAILLRVFSVQTTFQGRGIAQRSLKLLPDFVREHFPVKDEIILAVNCRNRRAQYVYQKAGFEDKGIRVMGKKGELIVLHMELLITKTISNRSKKAILCYNGQNKEVINMSSEMEKILRSVMKEELTPIQTDITGLKSDMTSVKGDITGLKSDMTSVKDDITGLKSDMTSVKDDITGLKSDMTSVKDDITGLKSDMTSVKDDITGLKSDMTSVKDDITGLKSDTTDLKEGQAQLRKDIIQHLGKFTEQIAQHVDDQTAVLNKRVFIILGEKTPSSAKQGGD